MKNKFLTFLLCWAGLLSAQTPTLVQDIGTIPTLPLAAGGQQQMGFVPINGYTLFIGNDETYGTEIWRTDGTTTQRISNIVAGADFNYVSSLFKLGNIAYFVAGSGTTELYRTDGTAAGTFKITTLNKSLLLHAVIGTKLFLTSNTNELLVSDGTAAGTTVLKTFVGGMSVQMPTGNKFFFIADDGSGIGTELWVSDGTALGTKLAKDFTPSGQTTQFYGNTWAAVGNTLFLSIGDNLELWKSDGTPAGTVLVKDINPNAYDGVTQLNAVGNTLFFTAYTPNAGLELWKSNGTAAGTFMLKDAQPGADNSGFTDFMPYLGKLLFTRRTTPAYDTPTELWSSNGTSAGTVKLFDLGMNPNSNFLGELNGKVYFTSNGYNQPNSALYATTGTAQGTSVIGNVPLTGFNENGIKRYTPTVLNGKLYFGAQALNILGNTNNFPAVTDGTVNGTSILKYVPSSVDIAGNPYNGTALPSGSSLFFATDPTDKTQDLWVNNGTTTTKILEGNNSTYCCSDAKFAKPALLGSEAIFLMENVPPNAASIDVWKTNGTAAGTMMLKSIPASNFLLNGNAPILYKNKLYFLIGNALWQTNGTAVGTIPFLDATTFATANSGIANFAAVGDSLYLAVLDGINSGSYYGKIFRTNETGSTTLARDFGFLGYQCGGGITVQNIDNQFVYTYTTCSTGGAGIPFQSNTTIGGKNIKEGSPMTGRSAAIFNGELYYMRNGTLAKATATTVSDLNPSIQGITEYPQTPFFPVRDANLKQAGNALVFIGSSGASNFEPYKTDGISAGTVLLKEINPSGASNPDNFVKKDANTLLFTAFDGTKYAWWKTDGTAGGTVKIADFPTTGSKPNLKGAWLSGNTLYFSGNDGLTGQELWKLDLQNTPNGNLPDIHAKGCPDFVGFLNGNNLGLGNIAPACTLFIMSCSQTVSNLLAPNTNITFKNRVYLSTDANFSPNDVPLVTETITTLIAGCGQNCFRSEATFPQSDIPANIQPGQYYLIILSDADDQITESDETNNVWSKAVTVIGTQPPTNCTNNLLQNPGFENDLTNWEGTGAEISSTDVASGTKSLKMCTVGGSVRQTLAATAGKTYSLNFKVKTAGVNQNILLGIKFLSSTWQVLGNEYLGFDSPGAFSPGTMMKTAPAGTAWVEISLTKQNTGCIYVDDLCLTDGGTAPNPCSPDLTKPVIVGCPSNQTVTATSGSTSAAATWTAPTATDNCAGTVALTSTHTSGSNFPIGSTTVTYTAKDLANNSATCAFAVTVLGTGGGSGADLEITMTSNKTTVPQWGNFTVTVTAKNTGNQPITNATINIAGCSGMGSNVAFDQSFKVVYAGTPAPPTVGTYNFITQLWSLSNGLAPGASATLTLPLFTTGTGERKIVAQTTSQSPADPDSQPSVSFLANCTPVQDDEAVVTINMGQQLLAGSVRQSENILEAADYQLFPNPAGESVFVQLPVSDKPVLIQLFNQLGYVEKIHEFSLPYEQDADAVVEKIHEFSLRDVKNGVYFLKITVSGERAVVRKLVVSRMY